MNNIITFRPKHEFDAIKNINDFIDHCKKKLDLYGKDLDWEADTWDATCGQHKRRGQNQKKIGMVFGALGTTRLKIIPAHAEFKGFSKGYMRYDSTVKGTKSFYSKLIATRILENALIECSIDGIPRVHLTDETVADAGVKIIEKHYQTENSRYGIGKAFQELIEFLVKNNFVTIPFKWECGIRVPDMAGLVGEKHEKRRAEKLPSRETLAAIGTIFDKATNAAHIIITSIIAILCSAPGRICEAVTTQNHCEVWLENDDETKDLSLRWYPAKNGPDGLKHVLKEMEQVAVKALEKSRKITEEGRRIAGWYEKHPNKIYLPGEMEHLRNRELINDKELAQLFGWKITSVRGSAKRIGLNKIKITVNRPDKVRKDGTLSKKRVTINMFVFEEVERKILNFLPIGFPWLDKENDVKYSDALFVVPKGIFGQRHEIMHTMFEPVNVGNVVAKLAPNKRDKSIFDSFDLKNPDGSRMRMTTHQARHWLNTIAERGGLSDLERDMWSGRTPSKARNGESGPTTRQSLAYLHSTVEELMETSGLEAEEMDMDSSLSNVFSKLPISYEEFAALENKPTVHVTEFGVCIHDFAMQPCQVHADCLNCMEHACIKGDMEKADRIRECYRIAVDQLEMARQMVDEGYLKAERWYEHQVITVKRLKGLLEILDDKSTSPDSFIYLKNPFQYSAFRNAIESRATNLGDDSSIALAEIFKVPLSSLAEKFTGGDNEAFV